VTADGVFGIATDSAIRIFQGLFGLTVDGVVGPATWERLMQAAADASSSAAQAASESFEIPEPCVQANAPAQAPQVPAPFVGEGLPVICPDDWIMPLVRLMFLRTLLLAARRH